MAGRRPFLGPALMLTAAIATAAGERPVPEAARPAQGTFQAAEPYEQPAAFSDFVEVVEWHTGAQSLGKFGSMLALRGVIRNISAHVISGVQLQFALYDGTLSFVKYVQAYPVGARTMRLRTGGENVLVLAPGDVGVFEVLTGDWLPAAFGGGQLVATSAAIVEVDAPLASVSAEGLGTGGSLTSYTGRITNNGPAAVGRLTVHAASLSDDVLLDLASAGPSLPASGSCGGAAFAALQPGEQLSFTVDFGPGTTLTSDIRLVPQWSEIGTLTPRAATFAAAGGNGSTAVAVEAPGWCAASEAPWITITGGSTGTGHSGVVTFSVDPNPGAARSARIVVSGMLLTVSQAGGYVCPYAITPSPVILGADGAARTVTVTTDAGCSRLLAPGAAWLSVDEPVGTGTGPVTVAAAPNSSDRPRSDILRAGATAVTVRQFGRSTPFDLDADGHMDLVWQHQADGSLAAWLMSGATTLNGLFLSPPRVADLQWEIAGTGDVNGDRRPDLLWRHAGDGRIAAWLMQGTVQLAGRALVPASVSDPGWHIRAAADLNADGAADLIWQHDDGRLAVWFMNGLTAVRGDPLEPAAIADPAWRIAGAGDFDADGSPDLVWHHADGRAAVWLMSGTSLRDGHALFPSSAQPGWQLAAVGDLNGDGSPDLVWQHSADGNLEAWLMMGSAMVERVSLGQVSDTGWVIVGPR